MKLISTTLLGTSIIGTYRGASTATAFSASNPATGEDLEPPFHSATPDEIDRAVHLAEEAFIQYAHTPVSVRATFLRAIAAQLEENQLPLIARAMLESGLPNGRLTGELARTTGQLRLFADHIEEDWYVDARIEHADPTRQPVPKPDLRSALRPLGPVVVFGASNFPFAFSAAGGDTASALAAGCPVIVKAHNAPRRNGRAGREPGAARGAGMRPA